MTPIAANKTAPRLLNRHLPSPPERSRHAQTTERRDYSGPQARPGGSGGERGQAAPLQP
jgi:hypothetical protein